MSFRSDFFDIKLRPWWLLRWMLSVGGFVVCIFTICGFAGRLWWFFELFSHFRLQYLIILGIVSIPLLLGRSFRVAAIFGLCAALNFAFILPYYVSAGRIAPTNSTVLRAISINVNTANKRYDLVKRYVDENSPDFLLLVEVDEGWLKGIAEIEQSYPYRTSHPQDDNFGIALYSKHKSDRCEVVYLSAAGIPSIIGDFEVGGKRLTIIGTHPLPPIGREYALLRNNQLDAIAERMSRITGYKMLLGDLNTTPWSYQFGKLLKQTALHDSARGFGLQLSWPTHSLVFRIPIDHCLVSSDIEVVRRSVGRDVGSDHFPILIDLILTD